MRYGFILCLCFRLDVKKAYSFNPVMKGFDEGNLLGAEISLWTEVHSVPHYRFLSLIDKIFAYPFHKISLQFFRIERNALASHRRSRLANNYRQISVVDGKRQ